MLLSILHWENNRYLELGIQRRVKKTKNARRGLFSTYFVSPKRGGGGLKRAKNVLFEWPLY
jgi:hypothetical protein